MEPWERRLAKEYGGQGARAPIKGLWIRGFLVNVREASVTEIHNAWNRFREEAADLGVNVRRGSSEATRIYLYRLRKCGLVKRRRVPHPGKRFPYSLYSVVSERLNDPGWLNPG